MSNFITQLQSIFYTYLQYVLHILQILTRIFYRETIFFSLFIFVWVSILMKSSKIITMQVKYNGSKQFVLMNFQKVSRTSKKTKICQAHFSFQVLLADCSTWYTQVSNCHRPQKSQMLLFIFDNFN